jgi:hypothetical protein
VSSGRRSGADPAAALPAACRENGATSPGAHAQPETVRLRAVAVVRLERTLAHWDSRCGHMVKAGWSGQARGAAARSRKPLGGPSNEGYAPRRPTVKLGHDRRARSSGQ